MSSFPTNPSPFDSGDDDLSPTHEKIDAAVHALRQNRSASVEDQRNHPRYSISEINDQDWDQVSSRLARTSYDPRGPVTKFLDMIDLPRNTIAGILAPGVRRRKEQEGETGTFGQGKVLFSDILGEAGMRPGIVRGVLGLAGDIALDPLTYVGGSGAAVRLTGKGGQLAGQIGRQGARALKGGVEALEAGKGVEGISDHLVRNLYHEHVLPTLASTATDAEKASALSKAGFGEMATGFKDRLAKGDIFKRTGSGGALAESAGQPAGAGYDAAKAFMAEYGMGAPGVLDASGGIAGGFRMTRKGPAWGDAQAQIAHIPFTEFGINVPAFTSNSRMNLAMRVGALAKAGNAPAIAAHVAAFDAANRAGQLTDQALGWLDRGNEASAAKIESPHAMVASELHGPPAPVGVEELHGPAAPGSGAPFTDPSDFAATSAVPGSTPLDRANLILHGPKELGGWHQIIPHDEYDAVGHMLTNDEKAAYAYDRAAKTNLELNSVAEQAKKIKESASYADMGVSDMLNINRQWLAAQAARDKVAAELAAVPFTNGINDQINSDKLYAGLIGKRNTAVNDFKVMAESKLGTPGYHDQLKAAADAENASFLGPREPGVPTYSESLLKDYENTQLKPKIAELRAKVKDSFYDKIADVPDHQLKDAALRAEAIHAKFRAASNFADAVGGSIGQQMNREGSVADRAVADYAKFLFKLDDDTVGVSPMIGLMRAVRSMMGEKEGGLGLMRYGGEMDAGIRGFAGNRASRIGQLNRETKNALRNGSPYEVAAFLKTQFGPDIKDLMNKYQFTTNEQRERVMALWTARHLQKTNNLNPEKLLTKLIVDGKEVDTGFTKKLQEVVDAGWFKEQPNIVKDIDTLADKSIAHFKMLGEGLGSAAIDPYVPNMLEPKFAQLAREKMQKGFNVGVGADGKAASLGSEAYETHRNSLVYQWKDAEGNLHELWEPDFDRVGKYKEGALRGEEWNSAFSSAPKAVQDSLVKDAEEIKSFNQVHRGLSEDGRKLFAKFADPFTMTEVMNKRFAAITGGSPIAEKMMSDNMLYMLMGRQRQQIARAAKDELTRIGLEGALDTHSAYASLTDHSGLGKEFTFANGMKGFAVKGKDGLTTVRVGDIRYRTLNSEIKSLADNSLMKGMLDDRLSAVYMPEQKAELIENAVRAAHGEDISRAARVAQTYTSLWKTLTLAHPSWPIINLSGLIWQAAMGRIPFDGLIKHARDAFDVTRNAENLNKLDRTVNLAGQHVPLSDIAGGVEAHTSNGTSAGEAMMQHAPVTKATTYGSDIFPKEPGARAAVKREWESLTQDQKRRLELGARESAVYRAATPLDKIQAGMGAFADASYLRRFLAPMFKMNDFMERWFRTASYMSMMDKGMGPAEAGRHIKTHLYDFGDFTDKELNVRRWALPFYSWIRNNAAYQLHAFLEDPKFAAAVPKLKEAIEEATSGEQQVPEHMRPSWMREQLATQLSGDPDNRAAAVIGNVVNPEPVYQIGGALTGMEGVQNLIRWFISGGNPAFTVPEQLGYGRENFSGRTIGAHEGEGDLSASEFLLGQFRPLRELAPIGVRTPGLIKAFEEGPGTGAARLALGGRLQPFSEERLRQQLQRELDEKAGAMQKAIKVAEREGDHERSLSGRVRLMSLYADAQSKGLRTPAWSKQTPTASRP